MALNLIFCTQVTLPMPFLKYFLLSLLICVARHFHTCIDLFIPFFLNMSYLSISAPVAHAILINRALKYIWMADRTNPPILNPIFAASSPYRLKNSSVMPLFPSPTSQIGTQIVPDCRTRFLNSCGTQSSPTC